MTPPRRPPGMAADSPWTSGDLLDELTTTGGRRVSHQRVGALRASHPPVESAAGAGQLSRRDLLRRAALATTTLGVSQLLAACGISPNSGRTGQGRLPAGSLGALVADVPQLSILGAQSQLPTGRTRFAFGLAGPTNALVEGATPEVWLARDQTSRALGPFPARWLKLDGYTQTHDRSPRSELNGFYLAEVDLPQPGDWLGVAMVDVASQRAAGQGQLKVSRQGSAPVGSRAHSGPSPVATTPGAIAKVCTRTPVCPMHQVSFDQAVASGKPTVVSFATPLLCASRMCGPVVDEQLLAFQQLKGQANFIHVEIYPERDTTKPAPLYQAWGLPSEPWVFVIDRQGIIRARLGEGPTTAGEIQAALRPLL
jgi:hypothetical protein